MATQAELEELVVRFTGDAESYLRMLRDAQAQTAETARQVGEQATKIEGFAASLKNFGQAVVSGLAALGVGRLFGEAQSAWDEREQGIIRLNSALRANGRNVEETTASYRQFAQAQSQVTTESAGATMNLLRQAETFGVTGDVARRAVSDAQALAAVTRRDAESLLRVSVAVAQGNTEQLEHYRRMIPELGRVGDASQLLARYQQLVATGMETAAEMAATNNHQLTQASRAVRALLGDIGQLIDEALAPLATALKNVAEWARGMPSWAKTVAAAFLIMTAAATTFWAAVNAGALVFNYLTGGVLIAIGALTVLGVGLGLAAHHLGGFGAAWEIVKEKAAEFWEFIKPAVAAGALFLKTVWEMFRDAAVEAFNAITSGVRSLLGLVSNSPWMEFFSRVRDGFILLLIDVEFFTRNAKDVLNLGWLAAQIGFETFKGHVRHGLEVVLPAYIRYFADNWHAMWFDAGNFVGTVFNNLISNARRGFQVLADLARGRVKSAARFVWQPLTEGFQATMQALPNIPARVMGPLEQQLRTDFEALSGRLMVDQDAFRQQRAQEIADFWNTNVDAAAQAGQEAGQRFGDGFRGGIDAVLRFSAEAFARLAAYREQVVGDGRVVRIGGDMLGVAGIGGVVPAPIPAGASAPVAGPVSAGRADNGQTAIVAQLMRANAFLDRIANEPPVTVETADFNA